MKETIPVKRTGGTRPFSFPPTKKRNSNFRRKKRKIGPSLSTSDEEDMNLSGLRPDQRIAIEKEIYAFGTRTCDGNT